MLRAVSLFALLFALLSLLVRLYGMFEFLALTAVAGLALDWVSVYLDRHSRIRSTARERLLS